MKRILDAEYTSLGLDPVHGITDERIQEERSQLSYADYIFCANPFAAQTYKEFFGDESKIFEFTYGWDYERFANAERQKEPDSPFTLLFVGSVCVRKGAHLILRAWEKAGVDGQLLLAGGIEPAIKQVCSESLARDDVKELGYVSDIGALYRSAHAFAFPTLEEGGPLVTYEAAGHCLPSLLSPMAAGAILRDDQEAIVLDPHDVDSWADAIRKLASSSELRQRLGQAARRRVNGITWSVAGENRRKVFNQLFPGR